MTVFLYTGTVVATIVKAQFTVPIIAPFPNNFATLPAY